MRHSMLKKIICFLLLITSMVGHSQDYSALWQGYFSYYDIKDVAQSETKIYAASENAVFSYDLNTNEIQTITTIQGLSGETITTIHYSSEYQVLVIGYKTGLIEVYFESDGFIQTVVDIPEKVTIAPNKKTIFHFNEHNGLIYISTGYGISVYDLQRLEFGDTYFIGNGGSQVAVKQTTVFGDFIYAACISGNAIKKASINNPNIIDYQQWQTLNNGSFLFVDHVDEKLYAIKSNNSVYEIVNDNFNLILTYPEAPLDMRAAGEKFIVTLKNSVFVYNSDFNPLATATTNADFVTKFSSATATDTHIYIGTDSFGVLRTELTNPQVFTVIKPGGPLRNDVFKVDADNNQVWATFGGYNVFLDPYPLKKYGISHLVEDEWRNTSYDSIFGAINMSDIVINPFKTSQVYVSSFFSGLLELNNGLPTVLYNQNNSGLESLDIGDPNYVDIRVGGLAFDRTGLLWSMTSLIKKPLKSYNPATGAWQSYSFEELIPNPLNDESGYGSDLVIDNNGTKWTTSLKNGVIAYNENGGQRKIRRLYSQEQNMPDVQVKSLAIDKRNQLWIGTFRGLRILYNTTNFLTDPNPRASEIVIVEEGVPKELLSLQFITDIKVDGSNNKWIGTDNFGIFYFSPDGQETIYHFTTENSPLPSNQIRDISIDAQSGKVFIATSRGLVSFLSGGSKPVDALSDAFVYPNPVRPEYNLLGASDLNDINNGIKIKGLTENVNIKITDIAGNLVAEAQSRVNLRTSKAGYHFAVDGGTAIWNGRNLSNNIVASGVYLILINDLESFETKILKLLIIR